MRCVLLAAALCATVACADDEAGPSSSSLPDPRSPIAAAPDGANDGGFARPDSGAPALDGATASGPDVFFPRDAAVPHDGGTARDAAMWDAAEPRTGGSDGGPADAGRAEAGAPGGGADAGRPNPGPADAGELLHATIVVAAGTTFDGQGRRFRAGPELGDGSQSESQKPLFKLEHGARLIDVVLGSPAADGVHTYGDATLENIVWEDIGEDALTIKAPGTVVLRGGSARSGEDKVFQINAASTFRVSDFVARDAGKFIRQNGGTTFKVDVFIDGCDIANMRESIFRTDSATSTVSMQNTRYSNIRGPLFMGVSPANVTTANNTEY